MKCYLFVLVLFAGFQISILNAQETSLAADENMKPESFAQVLKTEWTFLRDEMDAFVTSIKTKDEFETTQEFEQRKSRQRGEIVVKLRNRINDQKFNKRIFKVLLKAEPKQYDADREEYILTCQETIEAPYNIPTVVSEITSNKYLMLSDSIGGGYRLSKISLIKGDNFVWHVTRDIAKMAKAAQSNLYFRVHFSIDTRISTAGNPQAVLSIQPRFIELVDITKNQVFWKDTP